MPIENALHVRGANLYFRTIGEGKPVFLLHGGPDFDHTYLLPSMDGLARFCRLIYYDQRGRGRSGGEAGDVTIETELLDLDELRKHFQYERIALLGHSWGAILGMKYAARFPERVSHLVLVNPASAKYEDIAIARKRRAASLAAFEQELNEIKESKGFLDGDPATVARLYEVVFRPATKDPRHAAMLDFRLEHFTKEGVVSARAIEERLYSESLSDPKFDMTNELSKVRAPTLVVHGADDFFPESGSERITHSITGARLIILPNCGHFAFLEAPDIFRNSIREFLSS